MRTGGRRFFGAPDQGSCEGPFVTSQTTDNGTGRTTGTMARVRATMPYLIALLLFGAGIFALYRLLAPVDIRMLADQIQSTPWHVVSLAMLASLAGYLCLAGYDWSALHHIGKPLPVPVVLSGGFLAYAFGNTIGLTAVSGAAVRWRLYSGLGLDGYDIAAVSTFTAMAFGVAVTLVGLAALAVHPAALASFLPLSASSVRTSSSENPKSFARRMKRSRFASASPYRR